MKKTLFITMITAALMGSAYANTDYSATPGTHCSPPDDVYGTYADTGEASGGSVEVFEVSAPEGYEYLDYVNGGYVAGDGNATENAVTINDGYVYNNVYGGYVEGDGNATGNAVTMTGGEVGYYVLGCYVTTGNATGNTVNMAGGEVGVEVDGGYVAGDGNATGNTVTIAGGEVGTVVAGGYVDDSGDATGNTVTITGGEVGDVVYGGFVGNSGDATGNTVTMSDGQVGNDVYGGYTKSGDATENAVTINDGQVGDDVYGGYTSSGDATDNTVTMTGGVVDYSVYGGSSDAGNASGNIVNINGGYVKYYVRGGYVQNIGDATGNTVTMTGGEVGCDVVGGYTYSGNATGNTVTMNGGYLYGYVYGCYVDDSGNATDNTVTMSGGEVAKDVYGGYTDSGDATGNTVTINDGYVDSRVYGGRTYFGDVTGNSLTMTGGEVGYDVYGGCTDSGYATDNTVTMTGGEVGGDVVGGYTYSGEATGNTVTMSDGQVGSDVYGGYVQDTGNATGNAVDITGGQVNSGVFGGVATFGKATDNTVTMTDGQVNGYVFGGCVQDTGDATGNTVTMTGGQVNGYVCGGCTYSGNATDNTVHLVGEGASYTVGDTTYKGGNIAIQGGVHAGYVEAGGVSSNNSAHIHGTGINIGGTIDSCQMLNFHIVQGQAGAPATPMVTLGGALDLDGVELGFYGDAVTDWAAFEGKSITLVGMTNETITGLVTPTDSVDITDEGGKTVATATLTLSDEGKALTLTNIQGVGPVPPPVPTAGPDALDVTLVNSLWASSSYVREFVRLAESQGYALKEGDTAVWGGGFGTFMHATGNRGFKSDGGGYGIGVNHAFSANTQAGISLGQGFGSYHNSGADGATVHQRAILAAATASTRIGKDLSIGAHLAFGNVRNRADCHLDGAPTERARWNDNVFNLGAQAAYDFHVTERTAITPFLGLDWMNGAHESFGGAYGRHYSHGRLNELRMPVGVTVSTSAEVGSTKLLPQLSVAYVPSLAQQLPHADVSGENGDYRVKGYAPGRNAFMLNVGVNAVFSDSWSAGAFYTLETRRHCVDQSVNASVRYTF